MSPALFLLLGGLRVCTGVCLYCASKCKGFAHQICTGAGEVGAGRASGAAVAKC